MIHLTVVWCHVLTCPMVYLNVVVAFTEAPQSSACALTYWRGVSLWPAQTMPGVSFGKLESKMGWNSQPTAAVRISLLMEKAVEAKK